MLSSTHPIQSKALLPWNLPWIPHPQPQFHSVFLQRPEHHRSLLLRCPMFSLVYHCHPPPPPHPASVQWVNKHNFVWWKCVPDGPNAWALADEIRLGRTCSRNTEWVIQILVNQRMPQKTLGNLWIPVSPVDLVSSFLKEAETVYYFFFLLVKGPGWRAVFSTLDTHWNHLGSFWKHRYLLPNSRYPCLTYAGCVLGIRI